MRKNLEQKKSFLSRYRGRILLAIDLGIIFWINFLLYMPEVFRDFMPLSNLLGHIALLMVCFLVAQLYFKTYDSLWRYADSREYLLLSAGMLIGFVLYSVVNLILETSLIWINKAAVGTALALLAMLTLRFCYRNYRNKMTRLYADSTKKIAIIGAGTAGVTLASELLNAPGSFHKPVCFFDDDPEKQTKRILGIPVYGPIDNLKEFLSNTKVSEIVFTIQELTPQRRAEILAICAETKCELLVLDDPLSQLKGNGVQSHAQLRQVRIEDLLGRDPVQLNNTKIQDFIAGKTVLVTGGGGSIGSELCRQIANHDPRRLVILDIAENTTYALQQDLISFHGREFPLSVEIASVRDGEKIERIFEKYHPDLVFHAAAHKHVPLMENCPDEAVKNNVFGTFNVASMAREYHAEKFVLISTDKAVNPTNIMGTTKCICEQILRALRTDTDTEFAAVRFGNVLGSDGSVIPLFRKQIERGGPVTITDKRIVRFFMTIPEAVQLVLEAGSYARSGELYVLDMGEPVRILDLAEKMITLSGKRPYQDIAIEEIGLRPGEKLYEELLVASSDLSKTENKKIFIEQQQAIDLQQMLEQLTALHEAAERGDRDEIVAQLRRMVPTFREPEAVNAAVMSESYAVSH